MSRLSASGLPRVDVCAGSAILPSFDRVREDGKRGVAKHAERERNAPAGSLPELSLVLNVLTGEARTLGTGRNRDYGPLAEGEIPGTADLVTVTPDRIIIRDYKTGTGFGVAAPKENLQLLHYAVASARVYHRDLVTVEIEFTDRDHVESADIDAFDLAAALARLRGVYARVAQAARQRVPPVVTGQHCTMCPAVAHCPAHREVLAAFGAGHAPAILPDAGLNPADIAQAWPIYEMAKRAMGAFHAAVEAYVSTAGPIPLAGGKQLALSEVTRETLHGPTVFHVLRDLHGEAVAEAACPRGGSKTSLEKAIGAVAPRGQKAGMVRAALAAIAKADGVNTTTSYTLNVKDAPAAALPVATPADKSAA